MENKVDHIIARVLNGEASSEEILFLGEWLNADKKNPEEFRKLKSYWDAEISFNRYMNPITSLEKLQGKINRPKNKNKQKLIISIISIAASIVITVAISSFFFLANTQDNIKEYYTYLTNDNKSEFILCDGTKITLNKNSKFTYVNNFGKNNRFVKLEGEAFFEVTSNPNVPFTVSLEKSGQSKGLIKVLGTVFNAKIDTDSDKIITTLIEGAVCFESTEQKVKLSPNQQLIFNYSTNNIDIYEVDIENQISWKEGLLKYKMISFTNLIEELKIQYNVQIIIDNNNLTKPSVIVSGTFSEEQSLDDILKVISRSLPIKWTKKNKTYHIW